MKREDLLPDDKKAMDDAEAIEDLMLNSRGYQIIRDWLQQQKTSALKIDKIDLKLSAEEIKLLIAQDQVKVTLLNDLEKFLIRTINYGKDLKEKLLDSGQGE